MRVTSHCKVYNEYTPSTCITENTDYPIGTPNTDLYAIIENQTGVLAMEPKVVWAAYDTEGGLVYVGTERVDGVGLFPESKIQISTKIPPDVQAVLLASEREIGEVISIAWFK